MVQTLAEGCSRLHRDPARPERAQPDGPAAGQDRRFIDVCVRNRTSSAGGVGARPSRFFSWRATCAASSARRRSRRAAWRGVPAPGGSTRTPAGRARGGSGGSGHQIPCESAWRCAAASTARWESRKPSPRRGAAFGASRAACRSTSWASPAWAWPPGPHRHASSSPESSDGRLRERLEPPGRLRGSPFPVLPAPRPDDGASPGSLPIRRVSCPVVSTRSIIYTRLNKGSACWRCWCRAASQEAC